MKNASAKALGFFMAAMMLGSAMMPAAASAVTLAELIELFIALDIIPADKAAQARTVLTQQSPATTATSAVCPYTWTRNITKGSTGDDVMKLQQFLNSSSDTMVASTGVGSAGNETNYFGSLSVSAIAKFQDKYASEVLTPIGLTSGTGYFGTMTRAKANELCSTSAPVTTTPSTGTTVVTPVGTGLMVSKAANQPSNSLAPTGAARVPFTRINLTAGTDGAVTVNSINVERIGLGADAAFAGIVLLDENGIQLGIAKVLNSSHQTTVGEAFTIPAGVTRTMTIAGNMSTSLAARAGEVPSLAVIGVNTSAAVSGALPIAGAGHTINATLSLGSITGNVSSFDPNTSIIKEIGTTDYIFSGIRLTAGSAEKVRFHSIRFNQTGSVSSGDIANVRVMVDGNTYNTTASVDGNYYTTLFPGGIVIDKGFSKDVYVKADIIGANAAARNVVFDIDRDTDIYLTGELYGYGITVTAGSTSSASNSNSQFTTGTPFYDGSLVTISAGSATTISKSNTVAAQNISVNVPNQPLGGFETEFKGEPVTVQSMTVTMGTSSGSGTGLLTNVSIVDENGSVVAGPVDATGAGTSLSFTDSITFPVGKMVYSLKGKVASGIGNGTIYTASTNPSSDWTNVRGDITGDTITLSQGSFSMNAMTVKAAALDISVSGTPAAQTITAGVQDFTFANIQLDATQSGEDVRFSSIPLQLTTALMTPRELAGCQLFDGGLALNTSNVVNPTETSAGTTSHTFTLDQSLVIAKGSVKTLAVKCDVSTSVSDADTLRWGIAALPSITVTGITSSNDVTETVTASTGQLMTVSSGAIAVSEDATSPSYTIVAAGSTGVTAGVMKFRASNEQVTLQRVGLQLTNTASSSASDLTMVSLWAEGVKVGEATFVGSNTNATSTLTGTGLVLPKDEDMLVTVKVDLANVGSSQVGSQGALIVVDVNTNGTNTQGVGQSGTTINATGSTSMSGIRMMRTVPTLAKLAVPSTVLVTGTSVDLYRFSMTAGSGGSGIGLGTLTVNVATSTGSAVAGTTIVTNLEIRAYTDASFSSTVSGFTNGILATATAGLEAGNNEVNLSSILQVPAGTTYYFRVLGDVDLEAGTGTQSGSVTTRIAGDSGYPSLAGLMGTQTQIDGQATNDNFVWSPNATTTSSASHVDWTNGYFVSGLPSDGTDAQTISK